MMKTKSRNIWLALAVALLCAGCAEPECRGTSVRYYDEAIAFQLGKRGVSYKASQGVVCVAGSSATQLRDAQADVEAVFNEVSRPLKDECEERAFAQWAQGEGLRFDVRTTLDAQNKPSSRMFLLRPFSREELAAYRAKLDGSPKDASCKPAAKKR